MPLNLKLVLMQLGNQLVTQEGFAPANESSQPSTKPIDDFTRWLNACEPARRLLAEQGIEWPVVKMAACGYKGDWLGGTPSGQPKGTNHE